MRIDQSPKIAATTFLRALEESFSSTERISRALYDVKKIKVETLHPNTTRPNRR